MVLDRSRLLALRVVAPAVKRLVRKLPRSGRVTGAFLPRRRRCARNRIVHRRFCAPAEARRRLWCVRPQVQLRERDPLSFRLGRQVIRPPARLLLAVPSRLDSLQATPTRAPLIREVVALSKRFAPTGGRVQVEQTTLRLPRATPGPRLPAQTPELLRRQPNRHRLGRDRFNQSAPAPPPIGELASLVRLNQRAALIW